MSTGTATIIIGLLSLALPSVGGAVAWLTARYVKQQWLRDLINAITSNAVARVEREIVQPLKSDPSVQTPDGKLTPDQAAAAKQAALDIAKDQLAAAGREIAPHILEAAIEAAVAAMKPKPAASKLPDSVKALFPPLAIVWCAVAAVAVAAGCNTLPNGWDAANAARIERATVMAAELFAGQIEDGNRDAACIVFAGTIAALHYAALEPLNLDKGVRAAKAISAADAAARRAFPDRFDNNRTLPDIILTVLHLDRGTVTDAEAMLALLRAALERAASP